ncbi:hypothetical protein HPB47_024303 [Ixodes persulcatus]|uniref:Uncharacterized protein n=1 Tax=Ixodes persulcatus TaxID=34615 RepID=A0AC60Q551_IXOPE|nr:hypothetical protein HPB47_024303 [Ixodes persulcatus]
MNHVWMLRLHSLAAKQKLVAAKELTVKEGRCLVFDPAKNEVKIKLHWVPYDVPNFKVQKELERFGKVSSITRECFRERGFENVESNTRLVQLTLKEGTTVDDIPHEIRLEGCKVLVLVPGRAPLCLRCRRTGHIRRDCRTPRCAGCHRFGHATEDCATTYASVARDLRDQEESEMFMDATEAEEVVQAVSQSTLRDERKMQSSTMASNDGRVKASQGGPSKMPASGKEDEGGCEASGSGRTRPQETPSCAEEKGDQVEQPGATMGQDDPMTESNLAGKRQLNPPPDPDFLDETEQSSVPWEQQSSKKPRRVHKPRVPTDDRNAKNTQ